MGMNEINGLILRFPPKVEAQKGHRKAGMGHMVLGQQKLLFLHIFAYNLAHFILDFNDFKKQSFDKSTRNGLALSRPFPVDNTDYTFPSDFQAHVSL